MLIFHQQHIVTHADNLRHNKNQPIFKVNRFRDTVIEYCINVCMVLEDWHNSTSHHQFTVFLIYSKYTVVK